MGDLSPLTESFVFGSSTGTAALGLNPDSPGLSRIVLVPESPFPRHSVPGGWRLGQNLGLWSAHRISDFITLQMLVNCLQRASQSRHLCPSHAFLGAEKTETKESTARSLPCPPICPGGSPRSKTQSLSFSLLSIKEPACWSCPVLFCAPGPPCSSFTPQGRG